MTDTTSTPDMATEAAPLNKPSRVLLASLIGTTIEFFDFYSYATAAVLVFPHLFFPGEDATTALLASFATFSIAFFARPLGAAVFGHFGDRVGRKTTLVAALLTMGISTVIIGLLPTYAQIGVAAPALLALCRFGQGFGLGGEWGGAVLIATENAPEGKKSWYGMFPQLGAPVGLFLSSGLFTLLLTFMSTEDLLAWGWRIPFLGSVLLIAIGLWVRLSLAETPAFQKAIDKEERVKVPFVEIFRTHKTELFLGTFVALSTFVLFYIGTAYLLSYNVGVLEMSLTEALHIQLWGAVVFGLFNPAGGQAGRPYLALPSAAGRHRSDRCLLLRPGSAAGRRAGRGLWLRHPGHGPDGGHLRHHRRRPGRAVPDRGALHRVIAGLQLRRDRRGLAGALYRDLAAGELRDGSRGLLHAGILRHHRALRPGDGTAEDLTIF